jgi:hypothetical protein
VEILN